MIDIIKKFDYFKGLNEKELEIISEYIVKKQCKKGEILIFEGMKCQGLYIITGGRAKVYKTSEEGREHILFHAGKGETFCDISLFDGKPSPVSVAATEDSKFLLLKEPDIHDIMKKAPGFSLILLRNFAEKARLLIGIVENLSFNSVSKRLAKILLSIIEKQGQESEDKIVLKRDMTLYEMASMVGTVREVATRALQKMEKEGILKINRRKIDILNLAELVKKAGIEEREDEYATQ